MTILFEDRSGFPGEIGNLSDNRIVISTGVMDLRPTQGDEKRLGPATTLYGTVALSFVIPRSRLACGKLREE
jgi:hypothetical protein